MGRGPSAEPRNSGNSDCALRANRSFARWAPATGHSDTPKGCVRVCPVRTTVCRWDILPDMTGHLRTCRPDKWLITVGERQSGPCPQMSDCPFAASGFRRLCGSANLVKCPVVGVAIIINRGPDMESDKMGQTGHAVRKTQIGSCARSSRWPQASPKALCASAHVASLSVHCVTMG
jgi:hypothetical protein